MANQQDPKQVKSLADAKAQLTQVEAEHLDVLERRNRSLEEITASESKLLLIEEELAFQRKEYLAAVQANNKADDTAIKLLLAKADAVKKLIVQEQELAQSEEELADKIREGSVNILEAATGIKTSGNALTGLAGQMSQGSKASDILSKSFGGVKGAAMKSNIVLGIAAGVMSKFTEASVKAFHTSEQLLDTLGRQAGLATERGQINALLKVSQASENVHVTFEALGQATGELQAATRGLFGNLLTGKKEIPLFASEMVGLGVDVGTTAEVFGQFGMILGKQGIAQIKKMETQTILLARTMGLSADSLLKDVAGMAEQLAHFGDQAPAIAAGMVKISAVTKVSSQSLLNFTEGFAHFDDAIQNANLLNKAMDTNAISGAKMFHMMQDGTEGPLKATMYAMSSLVPLIDDAFVKSPAKLKQFAKAMNMSRIEGTKFALTLKDANEQGLDAQGIMEKAIATKSQQDKATKIQGNLTKSLTKLHQVFAISFGPVVDLVARFVDLLNSIDPETLALASGALAGGIVGFMAGGPVGAAIGAITGGAGVAYAGTLDPYEYEEGAKINDGVVTISGSKIVSTPINSKDDINIVANRPGGPIATMRPPGGGGGVGSVELVVDLFGERLIKRMVDLVSNEQNKRAVIQNVVQGT